MTLGFPDGNCVCLDDQKVMVRALPVLLKVKAAVLPSQMASYSPRKPVKSTSPFSSVVRVTSVCQSCFTRCLRAS